MCRGFGDADRVRDGNTDGPRGDRGGKSGAGVLDGDAVPDRHAEEFSGSQVRLRVRFGMFDLVAGDEKIESVEVEVADDLLGHRTDGHGHEGGLHPEAAQLLEKFARSRPERDAIAGQPLLHAAGQVGDDVVFVHVDAVLLQDPGGFPETGADERHGVFVGPGVAEGLDEIGLRRDPIRFGIDECAVHIPEDGGGKLCSHGFQCYPVADCAYSWMSPRSSGRGNPRNGELLLKGRLLVVAFEGWNDAGEAATGAVRVLQEQLDVAPRLELDPELYYDYQFNRPVIGVDDDSRRRLTWPTATLYGPSTPQTPVAPLADDADLSVSGDNGGNVYLLVGVEPSRSWKAFTAEIIDAALAADISAVVFLGAMLADVPHTRPISIFTSSENPDVRAELQIERSVYEGPVGILSVLAEGAEDAGIPTLAIWASVPHYVHNAPSPKAVLALIDKLEEIVDVVIPRGDLVEEAGEWEQGIDALAGEDEDMAAYIRQLEQARDTVESPEASGEAIAKEFERYLRRSADGKGDGRNEPPTPR